MQTNGNSNQNGSARERVLDVAQELFHERGYQAVTMKDIARELGMRQASLYYHVPEGKEQLFVEVMARTFDRHRQGLEEAMTASDATLRAQLLAAAAWFASQPPMNLLSMMHSDMPALSPENTELLSGIAYRSLFQPLVAAFRQSAARGETRLMHPDLLAGSFLALMDGVAYSAENQPGAPDKATMNEAIISMIIDGLTPRQDPLSQTEA